MSINNPLRKARQIDYIMNKTADILTLLQNKREEQRAMGVPKPLKTIVVSGVESKLSDNGAEKAQAIRNAIDLQATTLYTSTSIYHHSFAAPTVSGVENKLPEHVAEKAHAIRDAIEQQATAFYTSCRKAFAHSFAYGTLFSNRKGPTPETGDDNTPKFGK